MSWFRQKKKKKSDMSFTGLHVFGPVLSNDSLQILQLFITVMKLIVHVL